MFVYVVASQEGRECNKIAHIYPLRVSACAWVWVVMSPQRFPRPLSNIKEAQRKGVSLSSCVTPAISEYLSSV